VKSINTNLPSFVAGLRSNDNVLEINGELVENLNHQNITKKVNEFPNHVDLLVVLDLTGYLEKTPNETKF